MLLRMAQLGGRWERSAGDAGDDSEEKSQSDADIEDPVLLARVQRSLTLSTADGFCKTRVSVLLF